MGLFSGLFGGGSSKVKIDTSKVPAFNSAKAIRQEAATNRVNQVTPFGSVAFSGPNRNNLRFKLSPQMQALLNKQTRYGQAGADIGLRMARAVPKSGQAATNAIMARLQPGFDLQDAELRNRLEQSGNPGAYGSQAMSEGAFNELNLQNQGFNDARLAAVLAGPQYQGQLAQNAAMMAGSSPIGVPQYNFQGATPINVAGTQLGAYQSLLGAATGAGQQNAINSQQGNQALFGGLFDLGAAGLGAAGKAGGFSKLFSGIF